MHQDSANNATSQAECRSQPSTVTERLRHLFDVVRPKGRGRPYSLEEVVAGVNQAAGRRVLSVQYLSQLRRGDRTNPSAAVLSGIAAFFGVPSSYFDNHELAERTDEELAILALMREAGLLRIAMLARGLSEDGLTAVETMIQAVRRMEGLPTRDADSSSR